MMGIKDKINVCENYLKALMNGEFKLNAIPVNNYPDKDEPLKYIAMSEQTEMKKEMQDASKKILAIKVKELVDEYRSLFPHPEIDSIEIERTVLSGFGDKATMPCNVTIHIIERTSILANSSVESC